MESVHPYTKKKKLNEQPKKDSKKQPINKDDEYALTELMFLQKSGMFADVGSKTLYIGGTKWTNFDDVRSNIMNYLNPIEASPKYKNAEKLIKQYNLKNVVGFSLGGAIADSLINNNSRLKHARIYNSPSVRSGNYDYKKRIFYHDYDPLYGIIKKDISPQMKVYKGHGYGHTMRNHKMIYN